MVVPTPADRWIQGGWEAGGDGWEGRSMEKLKWSGTVGSICIIPVVGICCVHYFDQKDCTARFATGAI